MQKDRFSLNKRGLPLVVLSLGALFFSLTFYWNIFPSHEFTRITEKTCPPEMYRTDRIVCLTQNLPQLISAIGVKEAMNLLVNSLSRGKGLTSNRITSCHDIAHAVGIVGTKLSGNAGNTLAQCAEHCTFGCYHGAIEGYVSQGGDFEHTIKTLCTNTSEKKRSACYHGLGHGAALVGGYKLQDALLLCDKLFNDDAKRDCGSGVLMELYEPSTFDHPRLGFPDDIPAFCSTLSGVYGEVCFTTAGLHEYGRSQDVAKAFGVCERVPQALKRSCMFAIGQNFYFSFQGEGEPIIDACKKARTKADYHACLEGALTSSLVSSSIQQGVKLCQIVEKEFSAACYTFLNEGVVK